MRFELKKLGKYEVIGELGRGAMGIVYRARDPIINRLVALKTITTSVADDPNLLQRFYREAQSAGALQHPNIVTIYDMGDEGGTPFIAMELVEGDSLEQVIARRATLPISLKLVYALQACRAFDFAHKRGIIHRDIKPGNVMVNKEGLVKVVDFGIARVLETSKTQTGMLIGTFAYMSPEQYHGEHADERSDIWSFGVLLYELLSYQRPFTGATPASLMRSICDLQEEPRPLRELVPECPAEFEVVIQRVLRKSAADRCQSMEDLLLELDPICKSLQSATVSELLARSRQLTEQRDYSEARDLLRQALQVDSTNSQARHLLEIVNAELKRILIRPKAQLHVEKGCALLKEGKIQEARTEAESALHLDSSFEPAQELQRLVQQEVDRAQLVAEWLQFSKQRLAEGMPDEAEALLAKVLEVEPSNKQAKTLQQQVAKEKEERRKRLRLLEGMQQARSLWTQQDYGECIQLLTNLQQEFLDEDEISKLLETVREDQAEQRKQQKLAEARNLLATQRFGDALAMLDALLAAHPKDAAVLKLRALVQHEQENQARFERLQRQHEALKKLVNEKKYAEVLTSAENLLRDFAGDADLMRLVEFARTQRAQIEQERRLHKILAEVRKLLEAGRFAESILAVQSGLEAFPENADLLYLRDQAETQKKKQLTRQLIEQHVREIRSKIHREELSDAIDLAQQTLATLGPDTDVSTLLNSARVEYQAREKKREKDQEVETIRTLAESGKLDEATLVLEEALENKVLDELDPRVQQVSEELHTARAAAQATAAPGSAPPAVPGAFSKEYAFQQGLLGHGAPGPPSEVSARQAVAPQAAASQPAPPAPHASAAPPVPVQPSPVAPQLEPRPEPPRPALEIRPAPEKRPPTAPALLAVPAPVSIWKRPLTIAALVLVVTALIVLLIRIPGRAPHSQPPGEPATLKPEVNPAEAQQREALNKANQLVKQGDLENALQILKPAASLRGPLTPDIQKLQAQVEAGIQSQARRKILQQEQQLWEQATDLFSRNRLTEAERVFRQVLNLREGGQHKAGAESYLRDLIPKRKDEERLFRQAQQEQAKGDLDSLQRALNDLDKVIAYGGPQKTGAEQLKSSVQARLDRALRDLDTTSLMNSARQDITRADWVAARQKADLIRQRGGDPSEISGEINRAEEQRFRQLEGHFQQLSQRGDKSALQPLRELQPSFQAIAAGSGSQDRATSARDYADRRIPAVLREIEARIAERKAEADGFRVAEEHYRQAVDGKDVEALSTRVRAEFQRIAQGGGTHVGQAREYLTDRIPRAIAALSAPTSPTGASSADREQILAVVQRYAAANSLRNLIAVVEVWPGLSDGQRRAFQGSFDSSSSIRMSLVPDEPQIAANSATVVGQYSTEFVRKENGRRLTSSGKFTMRLEKRSGNWFISSLEFLQPR